MPVCHLKKHRTAPDKVLSWGRLWGVAIFDIIRALDGHVPRHSKSCWEDLAFSQDAKNPHFPSLPRKRGSRHHPCESREPGFKGGFSGSRCRTGSASPGMKRSGRKGLFRQPEGTCSIQAGLPWHVRPGNRSSRMTSLFTMVRNVLDSLMLW
jgi:hypothetical protein